MAYTTIHESGQDGDKMRVDSWHNGGAYAVHFGENGSPSRTIFVQGDSASELRADVDAMEESDPGRPTREIWLEAVDNQELRD